MGLADPAPLELEPAGGSPGGDLAWAFWESGVRIPIRPRPQRLTILHLILGGILGKGVKALETAVGASSAPNQVLLSEKYPFETWLQTEILSKEFLVLGVGLKI